MNTFSFLCLHHILCLSFSVVNWNPTGERSNAMPNLLFFFFVLFGFDANLMHFQVPSRIPKLEDDDGKKVIRKTKQKILLKKVHNCYGTRHDTTNLCSTYRRPISRRTFLFLLLRHIRPTGDFEVSLNRLALMFQLPIEVCSTFNV